MPTPPPVNSFMPQRGDYRKLRCFQLAENIYDLTYLFCQRFLQRGDRTVDQMVQAARSGKQNIAEGSAAASTSKDTEIKLTNVVITMLHQCDYLLARLIESQKRRFLAEGGIREEMTRARLQYRDWQRAQSYNQSNQSTPSTPSYPSSPRKIERRYLPVTCARCNFLLVSAQIARFCAVLFAYVTKK